MKIQFVSWLLKWKPSFKMRQTCVGQITIHWAEVLECPSRWNAGNWVLGIRRVIRVLQRKKHNLPSLPENLGVPKMTQPLKSLLFWHLVETAKKNQPQGILGMTIRAAGAPKVVSVRLSSTNIAVRDAQPKTTPQRVEILTWPPRKTCC